MWNLPNIISLFRLILAFPMAYFLCAGMYEIAIATLLLAAISDVLDGYFARKNDDISEFGKIIDPLADKVFINISALMLIIKGLIPIWFAVAVIARDLIILSGGLYSRQKLGYVIPSNYIGKVTVILIGFSIIFIVLDFRDIINWSLYLTTLAMIVSLISYFIGMMELLKKKR
jgi:CDP-diacylglycerol--glycerol-3-phosphate 3-phosphatidyltransferase